MNKAEKEIYKQIAEEQTYCYFNNQYCKGWLETHHVFRGKNRNNSTKYKMLVRLCNYHHDNMTPQQDLELKKIFQSKFEKQNTNLKFIDIFRRNYL